MIELQLRGFDETVDYIEGLDIPEQLHEQLGIVLTDMTRFAAAITPVVTGAMRRAWEFKLEGLQGRMAINPTARNPRSGVPVRDYASIVAEREGILEQLPFNRISFELEL